MVGWRRALGGRPWSNPEERSVAPALSGLFISSLSVGGARKSASSRTGSGSSGGLVNALQTMQGAIGSGQFGKKPQKLSAEIRSELAFPAITSATSSMNAALPTSPPPHERSVPSPASGS